MWYQKTKICLIYWVDGVAVVQYNEYIQNEIIFFYYLKVVNNKIWKLKMKWAFSLIKKGTPPPLLPCDFENLLHLAEIGNYAHACAASAAAAPTISVT